MRDGTFTFNELLERELSGRFGQAAGERGTFVFCEPHRIPELEVRSHAEQHQIAFELRTRSQLGGNQQSTGAVEIDISGVAEQEAL